MDTTWFMSFIVFTLAMGMRPTANNSIILSTVSQGNTIETIKHILVVSLGHAFLLLLIIFGLAKLITLYAWVFLLAKYTGITYILYLVFEMLFYKSKFSYDAKCVRTYSAKQLIKLQFANPQNWIMTIAIATAFLPFGTDLMTYAFVSSIVFGLSIIFTNSVWAIFSTSIQKVLSRRQSA